MRHVKPITIAIVAFTCTLVLGCMPKMTLEEMKEMMPKRPPELDKLNAFAGQWEHEGEAKMAVLDQPVRVTGTSKGEWEGDGWYLVSRSVFSMEGLMDMEGLEAWTFDTHSKKYRSTYVDTVGTVGTAESWHDEKTNTWHMRATSHGPNGNTRMCGTVEFVDDNTMEWTMVEYAGLTKMVEMSGVGRRK